MTKISFIITLPLFILASCGHQAVREEASIEKDTATATINIFSKIRDGDIVFRNGKDHTSEAIRDFSLTDKSYSHCGIALREGDSVMIYHMYAGQENPTGEMQREWINYFIDGRKNLGFAVYRYTLDSAELLKLAGEMRKLFNRHTVFDMNFDYNTDDKQYCAEMISKALDKATAGRIKIPHTKIEMNTLVKKYLNRFPDMQRRIKNSKLKHLEYIAIDNLYLNDYASKVGAVSFE